MAAVHLAYDPNFRRNVAVKLVSGNFQENHIFRERFEREAHLIAKIEHPAIVPVYDFGEQDNQLYLVMRYMPGGSLTKKIKERALTFSYASQVISQIAPALDAVHTQGIVHRDLKPGNILFDGFGNPAISDFGIAHFSAATTDLTGSAIIGTPSYMSPEQVRGDAKESTWRKIQNNFTSGPIELLTAMTVSPLPSMTVSFMNCSSPVVWK